MSWRRTLRFGLMLLEFVSEIKICQHQEFGSNEQVNQLADESRQLLAILSTINRKAKLKNI